MDVSEDDEDRGARTGLGLEKTENESKRSVQ